MSEKLNFGVLEKAYNEIKKSEHTRVNCDRCSKPLTVEGVKDEEGIVWVDVSCDHCQIWYAQYVLGGNYNEQS